MNEAEFLSQIEKDLIRQFMDNKPLCNAVKKALLAPLYGQGIMKPGEEHNALQNAVFTALYNMKDASNEEKGAKVSAMYEGILLVEAGFEKMDKETQKVEDNKPPKNPAR